jgi:hypothetical protein
MKKILLCFSISLIIFTTSCQKEVHQDNDAITSSEARAAWMDVNLGRPTTGKGITPFAVAQQQVTAYLFQLKALSSVVNAKKVVNIRFVLSLQNNAIAINAVGVDNKGKELVNCNSAVFYDPEYDQKLIKLNTLNSKENASQHILSSKNALAYIQRWKEALKQGMDLNSVTSYNKERIYHFSMPKAIMQKMILGNNSNNIALFLGINNNNKMTTVFMKLERNNASLLPNASMDESAESADPIYDFSEPCPPLCN